MNDDEWLPEIEPPRRRHVVAIDQRIEQRLADQTHLPGDQIHSDLTDRYVFAAFQAAPIAEVAFKRAGTCHQSRKARLCARRWFTKENVAHSTIGVIIVFDPADDSRNPMRWALP